MNSNLVLQLYLKVEKIHDKKISKRTTTDSFQEEIENYSHRKVTGSFIMVESPNLKNSGPETKT